MTSRAAILAAAKMMFKCKHPFESLKVVTGETRRKYDDDFNHVTYHFQCDRCKESLDFTYAELIGGVKQFFNK